MIVKVRKNVQSYPKKIDVNKLTSLPFFQNLVEKENKEMNEQNS